MEKRLVLIREHSGKAIVQLLIDAAFRGEGV